MENWRFKKDMKRIVRKLHAAGEKKLAEDIAKRALEYGNTYSGRVAMCDGIRKLLEIEQRGKQQCLFSSHPME